MQLSNLKSNIYQIQVKK